MNHTLRLTPSNSPFFKTSTPRSPTKAKSDEPGLQLKKVIGTTTASANGFDCLPSTRQFVCTAGAAVVVSTVGEDLKVTQRFFRARPTLASGSRDVPGSWPISPTPNDPRSRLLGGVREQGVGGSPLGASGRDWSDSPSGKSATAKDRVKAATSVALSPNGKWVAVGETGYKPRILIFSNQGDSSETPVSSLTEHTFGVHALAFSPDSRYLASLGTVNDGFLYIWGIDDATGAATLHSSNKCTVLVNSMTWVGGSVLTVGVRFVKLWRPTDETRGDNRSVETTSSLGTPKHKVSDFGNSILSPKHKVLFGKNCLLGDLIDATFVAAVPISTQKAVVCTGSEICVLDDSQKAQNLTAVMLNDFKISAVCKDGRGGLLVAGAFGKSKSFESADLEHRPEVKRRRSSNSPSKTLISRESTTIAMATINDVLVELDSRRGIRMTKSDNGECEEAEVVSHQLAAHSDPVLGVQRLDCESLAHAAFLTYSGNGTVQLWDTDGATVASLRIPVESLPEMYEITNELRAVMHLKRGSLIATGDKYGPLSILEISTGLIVAQVRAHSAEIVDIATIERSGVQLVVTASRDRTVQLFAWNQERLDLLQTMDEHAAVVSNLLIAKDGDMLLSCSSDRTVVVREAMNRVEDDPTSIAFIMLQTINLKSSPTSMCLAENDNEILVATMDRCIGLYNIQDRQAGFSFKCSDADAGEAVVLSKILYAPSLNGSPAIVGVSSSDKSVRLYSEYGSLIARDWGHTEGITDVASLPSTAATDDGEQDPPTQLVTVAADSTVFMWDTVTQPPTSTVRVSELNGVSDTPTASKLTPMRPPLRKVLSHSEMSRFRRDKSTDEGEPTSPLGTHTPTQPLSPQRLKKKPSRTSLAQAPRLEPGFRSSLANHSRRRSLRKRSPSPPSPRNTKKDSARRPSLGMTLRSKSSENVLSGPSALTNGSSAFGSLNASAESVCRTLRAYRKKLANTSDSIAPDILRELEKEMKLTARVVGEKSSAKGLDQTIMSKLLEQASEKMVSRLDERIKERVGSETRKSSEGSPAASVMIESPAGIDEQCQDMDAVAGALEKVSLQP